MYHRFKKGMTVSELIEDLQMIIADLSLKNEDDIIYAHLEICTEQSCRNDIAYDQAHTIDGETQIDEVINSIPPPEIIRYFLDSEEEARNSDDYWDRMQDSKREIWSELIKNLPKELRDKYEL
jgi:hypothetical protein